MRKSHNYGKRPEAADNLLVTSAWLINYGARNPANCVASKMEGWTMAKFREFSMDRDNMRLRWAVVCDDGSQWIIQNGRVSR